jgi:hypothetical protein
MYVQGYTDTALHLRFASTYNIFDFPMHFTSTIYNLLSTTFFTVLANAQQMYVYVKRLHGCKKGRWSSWGFAEPQISKRELSFLPNRGTTKQGDRGCQMVHFKTKYSNLGFFLESYNGRCWYILCPFSVFYGHLVYCMAILVYLLVIWYIFSVLVCCS